MDFWYKDFGKLPGVSGSIGPKPILIKRSGLGRIGEGKRHPVGLQNEVSGIRAPKEFSFIL